MERSADAGALIPPTFNPALERALREKLSRVTAAGGAFGVLEALAMLLGLIQNSLAPTLERVGLALVAADHGFASGDAAGAATTAHALVALREDRLPLAALARIHEVALHVVHASGAPTSAASVAAATMQRVRSTADARRGPALTSEQAHAALRLGMTESERVGASVLVCAALGAGANSGAALVLGALTHRDPLDFAADDGDTRAVLDAVRSQHAALWKSGAARDPVEVLAALGGLEVASAAGLILGATGRRCLVLVDGMAALAALQVATRIAPYVADYCIPVRSHARRGIAAALNLCRPALPSEIELDAMDGTAGVLAVPLLRSAAALLATRTA